MTLKILCFFKNASKVFVWNFNCLFGNTVRYSFPSLLKLLSFLKLVLNAQRDPNIPAKIKWEFLWCCCKYSSLKNTVYLWHGDMLFKRLFHSRGYIRSLILFLGDNFLKISCLQFNTFKYFLHLIAVVDF